MLRRWLVYNGSNSVSLDDRPYEEGNTSWGHEVSFGGEKMADLVHGEPNCWQAARPEEEEADKVHCVRS